MTSFITTIDDEPPKCSLVQNPLSLVPATGHFRLVKSFFEGTLHIMLTKTAFANYSWYFLLK